MKKRCWDNSRWRRFGSNGKLRYISYLTGVSSGQARSPGHISILNTAARVVLIGCDVSFSRFLLIDLTWRKSVFNFKSTESFIVWFSFWNVMICCFSSSLLTVNEEIFGFFGEFVGQKTCEVVTLSSGKLGLEDSTQKELVLAADSLITSVGSLSNL